MRKIALLVGVAGLLTLPPSVASAGGKPTRFPLPAADNTFDFAAGTACSFELAGQPVANNETLKTYPPEPNGDVVQIVTGTLKEQLTNVGTGKSIVVNISGPARFTVHPDGSQTGSLEGNTVFIFSPADSPAGPATYVISGHAVINITAGGQLILVSQSGTVEDICAALS